VERGKSSPSLATAHRIADALGVGLQDLFNFDCSGSMDRRSTRARRIALYIDSMDEGTATLIEDFVVKFGNHLKK
jgi:DNA-binding XRE family transcriptional regulator